MTAAAPMDSACVANSITWAVPGMLTCTRTGTRPGHRATDHQLAFRAGQVERLAGVQRQRDAVHAGAHEVVAEPFQRIRVHSVVVAERRDRSPDHPADRHGHRRQLKSTTMGRIAERFSNAANASATWSRSNWSRVSGSVLIAPAAMSRIVAG